MAKCAHCGATILFGGVREGDDRYCDADCQALGTTGRVAALLPDDLVDEAVAQAHAGPCPQCGGDGPVDIHTSHRVWSALVMTSWSDHPEMCCRSCAVKNKLVSIGFCGVLGWWGFPWGLLATPIQIGRNVFGLFGGPRPEVPSEALRQVVVLGLGHHVQQELEQRRAHHEEPVFDEP
jgi:hypothetical protein